MLDMLDECHDIAYPSDLLYFFQSICFVPRFHLMIRDDNRFGFHENHMRMYMPSPGPIKTQYSYPYPNPNPNHQLLVQFGF